MQVERQTFTSFEKLLVLLQIPLSEDILVFNSGKMLRYETPRDFDFNLSNLYNEVLTNISNIRNKERYLKAADEFIIFAHNLRIMIKRIFKGYS